MILATLTEFGAAFGRALLKSCRDLAPIITVVALFQILVLHQAFPELLSILAGLGLVIVGLTLFVVGLDIGLFPWWLGYGPFPSWKFIWLRVPRTVLR